MVHAGLELDAVAVLFGHEWGVDMLTVSVGHAHAWRPGVGMRALCPFPDAGAGHARRAGRGERGWGVDMPTCSRGTCSFLAR